MMDHWWADGWRTESGGNSGQGADGSSGLQSMFGSLVTENGRGWWKRLL